MGPVRTPRLTLVAHGLHDQGGTERAAAEFARRAAREYAVTVVSCELADDLRGRVQWVPIAAPRRPFLLRFAWYWLVAPRQVRRLDADVTVVIGAIVPAPADVAFVQFCHHGFREANGGWSDRGAPLLQRLNSGLIRAVAGAAERWCYRPGRCSLLLAGSTRLRSELVPRFAVPAIVVPNGIDLGRFRPDPGARAAVRAERGAAEEDIVVLFVGGDWYRKGLHLIVEALGRLHPARRAMLWVDGDGPVDAFEALAAAHGVGGAVRFLGKTRPVERSYQGADIFVLASSYETFSLAAHEAAATGVAVVATDVGGVDELVGAGGAGLLVERTVDSLVAALARLVDDADLRRRLGAAGQRWVADLTWDNSARLALEACRTVMAGARAGGPAEVSP